MRGALLGSAVTHVAVLAALFTVRRVEPLIVPGPDVVQVSLLEPGAAPQPPRPAPPAPRPAVHVPDIKPEEAEGVKLAPPRKPPRKAATPPAPAPPATPALALPYAKVGSAGLSGAVGVDQRDFEFTYYLMLIRNKVAQNWAPPAGVASGRPVRAVVYFHVGRAGAVSDVRLESGSGVEFFDRSALRAVALSDPLPPLPLGFPGSDLGVHFGFEYEQP